MRERKGRKRYFFNHNRRTVPSVASVPLVPVVPSVPFLPVARVARNQVAKARKGGVTTIGLDIRPHAKKTREKQ